MALLVEVGFDASTPEVEARSQAIQSWTAAARRLGRTPVDPPNAELLDGDGELVVRVTGHAVTNPAAAVPWAVTCA